MNEAAFGDMREPDAARRAALELFDCLDSDDQECLVSMLDTDANDAAIVDRPGGELAEITGIYSRRKLLRWVTLVRPTLLERLAYGMNEAEDSRGGGRLWVVFRGTVVVEGGTLHRDLLARAPRRPFAVIVRRFARVRARGRRRRTMTRRTRVRAAGRRGRRADEPDLECEVAA